MLSNRHVDVRFDLTKCRPLDRFLSWSKIRAVGQLRLFLPCRVDHFNYTAQIAWRPSGAIVAQQIVRLTGIHDSMEIATQSEGCALRWNVLSKTQRLIVEG